MSETRAERIELGQMAGGSRVYIPMVIAGDAYAAICTTVKEEFRFSDPTYPRPNLVYNLRLCDPTIVFIPLWALDLETNERKVDVPRTS